MKTLQTSNSLTTFGWLVKREYWESRGGFFWAQFWAAAAILILIVLGIVVGEVFRVRAGLDWSLNSTINHFSPSDTANMGGVPGFGVALFAGIAGVVLTFVVFFYLLGALYDDRRDRSVLFWKSLPLSDIGTVLSKVCAAILVAPLIAIVIVLVAFVVAQIILSLWLLAHGINPFGLLWAHSEPYSIWFHMLVMIGVNAIWALPTVGWLLFWSAAARSKPFLWAIIVPVIAGVLNFFIALIGLPHIRYEFYWGDIAGRLLLSIVPGSWISPDARNFTPHFGNPGHVGVIDFPAMGQALMLPQMWIGAAVGIVLIAAAIWFRRWRDES